MKYLTKEWLNTELLSYTYSQIKISKKTEKYDEGYYQKLYKKICKLYIAAERGEELYQDPQEELRKIEESIAEPNITEEERAKRIRYKRDFISLNADRIKRGTYFKFDEKVVEQDFAVKIQQDIPNSGLSIILASELHYTNEKFELHFLIENVNEKNESQVGYLTLRGTDIKEIVTSEEV